MDVFTASPVNALLDRCLLETSTTAIKTQLFLCLASLLGMLAIRIAGPADLTGAAIAAPCGAVFTAIENNL